MIIVARTSHVSMQYLCTDRCIHMCMDMCIGMHTGVHMEMRWGMEMRCGDSDPEYRHVYKPWPVQ